ncbi:MAG: cyclase family protein [Burkholderiales bacterium]|nr:cyclase family protein [Burkholderiales bacterium]
MPTPLRHALLATAATAAFAALAVPVAARSPIPAPPWAPGDERGMANQIGPGTYARCAPHLAHPKARTYEVSQVRSGTMPMSPFAGNYAPKPKASATIPGTAHAFNAETYNENVEPGQQGTQFDALGHFAYFKSPWDGKGTPPLDSALYYGGFTQKDVKPTPDSPLLKLGMEKVPPIVTTAVLLDAKAHVGKGQMMKAGDVVTAADIQAMLKAQGLSRRGILPGDVVYIHTGWGELWKDPDTDKAYYSKAPGLSYGAALWLGQKRIVAVGLDTPFIDAVSDGMLAGKGAPAPDAPAGLPFSVHHHLLTQLGIHHVENARLDQLAKDRVWTSCTMILPLLEKGAAGSAIRPVAIGVPGATR